MVLTESGLMTATDHRAHVRRPVAGLNWTEFRDCFLRYQEDTADRHPAKVPPGARVRTAGHRNDLFGHPE